MMQITCFVGDGRYFILVYSAGVILGVLLQESGRRLIYLIENPCETSSAWNQCGCGYGLN